MWCSAVAVVYLSIYISVCPFIFLFIYLPTYLATYLHRYIYLSILIEHILSIHPSIYLSYPIYLFLSIFSYLSFRTYFNLSILSFLSYPIYLILSILTCLSYPIYLILSILSYLSYPICLILSILSYVSYPIYLTPSIFSYLSYPIYLILSILSYLSYPIYLTLSIFSYLSYPIYLILSILSYLSKSIYLSIYLSFLSYLSVYLSIWKLENKAILRDFLHFWTWQHQKRSNSARLPQFLNLITSKRKRFCETSSIFEVDNNNSKNEAILRDFLQKWQVECRADGLVPMRFAIFPYVSKVWRLPRKIDARSYEVLRLSRKIIFPKLKIWCSKMQRLSGHQRPDLPTSLMNMSLVLRLPREMHLCRSSANVPRVPSFLEMLQNPHVLLTFGKVQNPLRLPRKTTSEPSKVVRGCGVFNILTWKCASCHNGVHFFDISTFKSGPSMWCF